MKRLDSRGIAFVEFAIMFPIIIIVCLGAIEYTRAMKVKESAAVLSRELASYAQRTCNTPDNSTEFNDLDLIQTKFNAGVPTPNTSSKIAKCMTSALQKIMSDDIMQKVIPDANADVQIALTFFSLNEPTVPSNAMTFDNTAVDAASAQWKITSFTLGANSSGALHNAPVTQTYVHSFTPRYKTEPKPGVCVPGTCDYPLRSTCPIVTGTTNVVDKQYNFMDATGRPTYNGAKDEGIMCLLVSQKIVAVSEVSASRKSMLGNLIFGSKEVYDSTIL